MSLQFSETTGAMETNTLKELHLNDYKPPTHLIDKTNLTFELLAEDEVIVTSKLQVRPNPASTKNSGTLILKGAPEIVSAGEETPTMELLDLKVNQQALAKSDYNRETDELTLYNLPSDLFMLEIKTRINPAANRSLSGLYTSGNKMTTQCEAEGFRNITFYLDRPDVMSEFTTTIIAEKEKYPQLLSNGNLGFRGVTPDGRDTVTWHDPFKKPSYLFALVAGDLARKTETFITQSGRQVDIHLYVDHADKHKIDHAMASIKKSMKWDEDRFGREYDLNLFQVVAVNDFNMGAMENKGLNIFNSSAILADPKTATDTRYQWIQAVIGHEYFHNWSGNRVTCRDWFQLSLKEGFTVFRDSEFTSDLNSRGVKRIDDVNAMRVAQFPEDASAMAHPIRPSSVGSIDNFYTATIYNKGAEVIRMIHTLLGETDFRKGTDLYFSRHDGQAVTTEDFVKAMSDASGQTLNQFEKTWYNQAGTPTLEVTDDYDPQTNDYRLTLRQSTPSTPGQPTKNPFHIPVRLGLLNTQGHDIPLTLEASQQTLLTQGDILHLKENETTFVFKNVPEKPVPSLLRNWSAPVKVNYPYTRDELMFLMAHDSDGFNRWEAGQKLGVDILKEGVKAHQNGHAETEMIDSRLSKAFEGVLNATHLDSALAAYALALPSTNYLSELYPDGHVDVEAIHTARKQTRQSIGQTLAPLLLERFQKSRTTESRLYEWNEQDAGERAIKNVALHYLVAGNSDQYLSLALMQFDLDHNMTDVRSALGLILEYADDNTRQAKLNAFYEEHKDNALAIQQWFSDQALADHSDVLMQVETLQTHPAYEAKNPNFVRSLIGGFAANTVHFHHRDGAGYHFLTDRIIEIDKFNPQLAAGLAKRMSTPHKYNHQRQALIQSQLKRLLENINSPNVREIVSKSLDLLAVKQAEMQKV